MDILKNKSYAKYDYLSRYTGVPYYYNTEDQKEIYGIGKNMAKDIDFVSVEITQDDTLDKLALKYYGNPSLWWIIASFNDIQDSFIRLIDYFKVIKVPTMTQIYFKDAR